MPLQLGFVNNTLVDARTLNRKAAFNTETTSVITPETAVKLWIPILVS